MKTRTGNRKKREREKKRVRGREKKEREWKKGGKEGGMEGVKTRWDAREERSILVSKK